MATSGEHTNLTLRPRLMERGLYVWSRRASEVVIALGVVYLLASLFLDRKSQDILYMLATIAIVIAGRLIWPVFSRQSLAVTGDQLLIRTPLRRDRRVPLSAVTQVERVPLRSPVSRRLYGDMYVLLAGDATLTILSEGADGVGWGACSGGEFVSSACASSTSSFGLRKADLS